MLDWWLAPYILTEPTEPAGDGLVAAAIRRRAGWALRRYRGEHRPWAPGNHTRGLFPVDWIAAEVEASAADYREMHRRSLRRHVDLTPGCPLYIGDLAVPNLKFYGIPPDPAGAATFSFVPSDDAVLEVPVLGGATADDAPTGPIFGVGLT